MIFQKILKSVSLVTLCLFLVGCHTTPNKKKEIETVEQPDQGATFALGQKEFLLNGSPFQIISGEIHYARVPKKYWRHRIQMAKAMGCNTIASYVFWNYHEVEKGVFDFTSENRDLEAFIQIVKEEGLYMLFRPGPYVCGEWDLGGIPPYLLSIPDIKLRCSDSRYMEAVERYIKTISQIAKPHLITNGGPIIMLQIENEYGSYGNDRAYLKTIKNLWDSQGIDVPYYTSDGPADFALEAGTLPGVAVGLDPGANEHNFNLAYDMNPDVPVFSSETYPGWLTHWKESWIKRDTTYLLNEVKYLMDNKLSFNFYVLHGGTNFGFTAGANSGGTGYEPDVTSYDYDAPINEQGQPTLKYHALRDLIASYKKDSTSISPIPQEIESMTVPEIKMEAYSSIWNELPDPNISVQPKPFEAYNHYYGFAIYKTTLVGRKHGELMITDLHDYATVFLDGTFIGTIDRSKGEKTITIPQVENQNPVLEILVEGMGRINFGEKLIDRKGITERVSLDGRTLMNWEVYCLPMDTPYLTNLKKTANTSKPGLFFKGQFHLDQPADTYIDLSNYQKGIVWVNGHNLGRYWNVGPQFTLYCPEPFLKQGANEILIFDLHQLEPKTVKGVKTLND